jgi:hypothetical protein
MVNKKTKDGEQKNKAIFDVLLMILLSYVKTDFSYISIID